MPKLSIIIPIYKAEKYISRCIDSVLHQTFEDLEVILVDDGSPDRCPEICDAYAEQDARIRVIHQKNAGVSAARNRGLDAAQGEFIGFVDADDWIEPDMFSTLLRESENADLVMCDALISYEDGRKKPLTIMQLPESCWLSHHDFYPSLLIEFAIEVWRCIYRRSLIENHGIRFSSALKLSEDRVFNLYAMGYAQKIRYIKIPFYFRFINLESCVHIYHPDYEEQGKQAAQEMERAIAAAWENDSAIQQIYRMQYADIFFIALNGLRGKNCALSRKQRMEEIKKICSNPGLLGVIETENCGGRQRKMVLRKQYIRLYYYGGPFTRLYEGWLNIWYSSWVFQKIQNIKESYSSNGLKGILGKIAEKLSR